MAVADWKNVLTTFLAHYISQEKLSDKVVANNLKRGGGKKIHEKKPRKGRHGNGHLTPVVNLQSPVDHEMDVPKPARFSEIWHNNSPFQVSL